MDQQLILNMLSVGWAAILFILFTTGWYYIVFIFVSYKKVKRLPHSDKKTKFAVLIAARNESKVIHNILDSLEKQTYSRADFDVYTIVEDINDPTVEIAKSMGFNYFVRDEITPERRTKGFALQECIRYLKKNNLHYDAYMIFDADNVVNDDFIMKMNDLYQAGVQVGLGYRNFTNANHNWISSCSAILFSYMSQIGSRGRSRLFKKAVLCGTGYYVASQVIDDAGGWRFTGMTEDVQLTSYCYMHDVYMMYYPYAVFYDEQAITYREMHHQHVRWVWGFFAPRGKIEKGGVKYHTQNRFQKFLSIFEYRMSIIPFLTYSIALLILCIITLGFASYSVFAAPNFTMYLFWQFFGFFMSLYISYVFIALFVIIRDNHHLKLSFSRILWSSTTYLFFFGDFLLAVFDGLFHKKKRSDWKVIAHSGEVSNKDLK